MDDEFDSIDFFAIDKLVENHQAKLQVHLFANSLVTTACV